MEINIESLNNDGSFEQLKTEGVQAHNDGTSEEKIIQAIYSKRCKNDENDTTLAEDLELKIDEVFHDKHQFIYELLQNADDADAKDIEFFIQDKTLVISYNGTIFTETDVKRICNSATRNSKDSATKASMINKTGYKGVGFKSVFGVSTKVTILSGNYRFRFDKKYWDEPDRHKDGCRYPWPIIPILLAPSEMEFLDKIAGPIDKNKIYLFLENITTEIDGTKIEDKLKEILEKSEILVFLRKVKSITLKLNEESYFFKKIDESKLNDNLLSIQLQKTDQLSITNFWYKHREEVSISENIKQEIKNSLNFSYPNKFKEADKIIIEFAALIDIKTNKFIKLEQSKFFCYLPTDVLSGLPFLVNADFILDQKRGGIINNTWNTFLFEEIARIQFLFLKKIASTKFKNSVLTLIENPKKIGINSDHIKANYHEKVLEAVKNIEFIPSITDDLLTVKDCVIDTTNFFKVFENEIIDNNLYYKNKIKLVSYKLDNIEVLLNLKERGYEVSAVEYTWTNLLYNIENYVKFIKEKDKFNLMPKILDFFITYKDFDYSFISQLRNKRIIFTEIDTFETATKCFILKDKQEDFVESFLKKYELPIVALKIYDSIKENLTSFFNLKYLTKLNIIKLFIYPLIEEKEINKENSIELLRFIYLSCKSEASILEKLETSKLSRFLIKSTSGSLVPIGNSYYLKENKDKKNNINNEILNKNLGISYEYFQNNDDMALWEKLLVRAKIQTEVKLQIFEEISYQDLISYFDEYYSKGHLIQRYHDEMLSKMGNDDIPYSARPKLAVKDFKFKNFISFGPLFESEKLSDEYFQLLIVAIEKNWKELKKPCRLIRIMKRDDKPISLEEHFLTFYFKNVLLIKTVGTQNTYKKSKELIYSPKINHLLIDFSVNMAHLPIQLSLVQASLLGFRNYISIQECLHLLQNNSYKGTIAKLKVIYNFLIKTQDTINEAEIKAWKETNKLLAYDCSLQSANELTIYDLEDGSIPTGSKIFLHDCGMEIADIKKLSKALFIPLLSNKYAENSSIKPDKDQTVARKLWEIILDHLPKAVLVESDTSDEKDYVNLFYEILKKFEQIELVTCEEIALLDEAKVQKNNTLVTTRESKIYFKGRLSSPILREKIAEILGEILFSSPRARSILKKLLTSPVSNEINTNEDKLYNDRLERLNQIKDEFINKRNKDNLVNINSASKLSALYKADQEYNEESDEEFNPDNQLTDSDDSDTFSDSCSESPSNSLPSTPQKNIDDSKSTPLKNKKSDTKSSKNLSFLKQKLLNYIGDEYNDSKELVEYVHITRGEIASSFQNKNSYYSADYINLLLYVSIGRNSQIKLYPAITLNKFYEYETAIITQNEAIALVPFSVAYDEANPQHFNHWVALVIDKINRLFFYLDPAQKTKVSTHIIQLKDKLGYQTEIIDNPVDFQQKEKQEGFICHCGPYIVEIFKQFHISVLKEPNISKTDFSKSNITNSTSILFVFSSIKTNDILKIRESHIQEACNIIFINPEDNNTLNNSVDEEDTLDNSKNISNVTISLMIDPIYTTPKKLPAVGNNPTRTKNKKNNEDEKKQIDKELKQADQDVKNKELGNLGEKYVFEKIKRILSQQLKAEPKEGDNKGEVYFIINNKKIILKCYSMSKNDTQSEGPVDLTLSYIDFSLSSPQEKILYCIEVKSTNYERNPCFFLSANEWGYMRIYKDKSILVRVYDAMSNEPKLCVFKNPFKMIYDGLINLMDNGKFILNIDKSTDISRFQINGMEDKEIGCRIS